MVTKEQRRRQLAREKFERQQQRRTAEQSKARRRNSVIAAVVAVVVAAGATAYATGSLDGKEKSKTDAAASPSATTPSKAPDPCAKPGAGTPGKQQWKTEPAMDVDKSAKYTFTLQTTCGDIAMALDAAKAPATVNSFKFLADKGFFDHTKCHRLTADNIFVLQCGDPTGTGQGGPGYTIPDENLKDPAVAKGTYPAGTIAMANTGQPHTGGSQFFLVYKDSPLPASYTPFGTIGADGMKVLQKIAAAGAAAPDAQQNTAPNATVVINKAVVKQS
ncbi:peptidylprolyl isomerase [Streptomyces sp. SID13666]|uniref:peptidylprolyl isomerase n=1 Tax=unclassified Streptomyces TaxID=2593676 RepID=UPI0013C139C7|nr:peptidylprolyl isomerase [Streptomyces sp. SID13666]NEA75157.1 peptidylprolyl isomerase [Streptomyces sp. SID13588]